MTPEDVKQRCHVDADTGCWHWRGALSDGKWPRIYAPNLSKPGEPMEAQTGRRAVWQLATGKAIPEGFRVFGICRSGDCLNPKHMVCGSTAEWGQHKSKTGIHKTMTHRIGSRKTGKARSVLTEETYAEVVSSTEPGTQIAKRLGVSMQTVSKARRGQMRCFQPIGNPFSGLL